MNGQKVLSIILDLAVTPLTFDVVHAMVHGEVERRVRGYGRLAVIVVPPKDERRRATMHPYPHGHQRWRLRQLVVPCTALVSRRNSVIFCQTREEARGLIEQRMPHVFPESYDLDRPQEIYWFSHLMAHAEAGTEIRLIQATAHAREHVGRWLNQRANGRRVVAITLREADYSDVRNSQMDVWAKFVCEMDRDNYLPLVVRDISTAHLPLPKNWGEVHVYPEATWNISLRTALHELVWLNLFVNNGPAALAYLDQHTRFAILKMLADVYEAREQHQRRLGVEPYGQYPFSSPAQRLVWANDDIDTIRQAFALLNDAEDGGSKSVGSTLSSTAHGSFSFADRMRRSALQWQHAGNVHEAKLDLHRLLADRPLDAAALSHLSKLHSTENNADAAINTAMRAVLIEPGDSWHARVALAAHLDAIGLALESPGTDLEHTEAQARFAVRLAPQSTAARCSLMDVLTERALRLDDEGNTVAAHALWLEVGANDARDPIGRSALLASHAHLARNLAASGEIVAAWKHALASWRLDPTDPTGQHALALVLSDDSLSVDALGEHLCDLAAFANRWLTAPGQSREVVVTKLIGALRRALPHGMLRGTDPIAALHWEDASSTVNGVRDLGEALLCEAQLGAQSLSALFPNLLAWRAALLAARPSKVPPPAERLLAALACQADRHGHRWPTTSAERAAVEDLSEFIEQYSMEQKVVGLPAPMLVLALYQPCWTIKGIGSYRLPEDPTDPRARLLNRC